MSGYVSTEGARDARRIEQAEDLRDHPAAEPVDPADLDAAQDRYERLIGWTP